MFGHDDKKKDETEEHVTGDAGPVVQPLSTTPPNENLVGVGAGSEPPAAPASATGSSNSSDDDDADISKIVDDINATTDDGAPAPPAEPVSAPTSAPETTSPAVEPLTVEEPAGAETPTPDEPATDDDARLDTPADLVEVKKSALQELSPLLDELDQTPEEKLNILMMTIQATDDHALLAKALESAKQIEDKKARAEAMLDIIQEINYFTKKQ